MTRLGGHKRLRLEVIDDFKLGKILKHSGFSQALLFAGDLVRVRWQVGLHGVIKGLEKNGFAIVEYSRKKLIFITLLFIWSMAIP